MPEILAEGTLFRDADRLTHARRGLLLIFTCLSAGTEGSNRFAQLMGYSGVVCRKHSSGLCIQRGPINNTGNAHLRRIVV